MKNAAKLLGIFAIMALIGLCFGACNEPKSDTELTGKVSIDGIAQVGQVLIANVSDLGGNGEISYQWKRNSNTVQIIGSGSTYTVTTDDVGSSITVTVTRSDCTGSITSNPITISFSVLMGTVSILGTARVGETLSVNTAFLYGSGTISYQWMRNGSLLIGSSSTYMVTTADIGSSISVTVTRSDNSGSITSMSTTSVVGSQAQLQGTPGLSFSYIFINDGPAYSVSKGTATAAEIVIPEVYSGRPVVMIAEKGFSSYTRMTSITIPNSVTSIGNSAFSGCTGLTSVTFNGIISSANFDTTTPFPGDLRAKYFAGGGTGTYTRPSGSSTTWTKQQP